MTTLFQFNTAAVDLLSADGFEGHLNDLLVGVEQQIRDSLAKDAPNETYDVEWADKGIEVGLTQQQFDLEYGVPPERPFPVVRVAVLETARDVRGKLVISV